MIRILPAGLIACVTAALLSCAVAVPGSVAGSSAAAGTSGAAQPSSAAGAARITLPPANAQFDYQIGGPYKPLASTRIVDRDWHEAPAAGKYNVCYVNAFQTQPEDEAWWTSNHPGLLLRDANGVLVGDPEWGEIILDTRTAAKRSALAGIMTHFIARCASSGFKAVELDNLDTYTRSNGLLSYAANRAYARLLIVAGHKRGLAMAQKNTSDKSKDLKAAGFDFAVAEECQVYGECTAYTAVYGGRVFEIEYTDAAFKAACKARGRSVSVIRRDLDVVPRGTSGYRYLWC